MSAYSGDRLRLLFLIIVAVALALGSFWLSQVGLQKMEKNAAVKVPLPLDFYVEKFNFVRMSKTGQVRYYVAGARLTHYPQQQNYEIQRPIMHSVDDQRIATTLRAERALIDQDNNRVRLIKNTHIYRPSYTTGNAFYAQSERLTVLMNEEIVYTDQPVVASLGRSTLKGTGLWLNNATRELRLLNKVNIHYPPPLL